MRRLGVLDLLLLEPVCRSLGGGVPLNGGLPLDEASLLLGLGLDDSLIVDDSKALDCLLLLPLAILWK